VTTITITAASVGLTVAQNGALSALRCRIADREPYRVFTLVDDAPPHDAVPWQLFNSDMLGFRTNDDGAVPDPYGCLFFDQAIAFSNLTVAACPKDSVFEADCTGALATPIPAVMSWSHTAHGERLKAEAQRREDEAIVRDEAIRTGRPLGPPPAYVPPADYVEDPGPGPDPETLAINEEAQRIWAAQQGALIRGRSLAEIRTELEIAAQRRKQAAALAAEQYEAQTAAANRIAAERAEAQAQATRLLEGR
jgi:hypothetical protein